MQIRRVALAATSLVFAAVVAGCVTPPSPSTTTSTSTTSTVPAAPTAGCYDNTADPMFADYFYSGTPNVAKNMTYHNSNDGTCSGATNAGIDGTLVLAASAAAADAICISIGGTGTSGTFASQGWTGLGSSAYVCNA